MTQSAPAFTGHCVNTLRFLSVDAVQKANSGHPGLPLGAAPTAHVLWTRFRKPNPANPGLVRPRSLFPFGGARIDTALRLLHTTGYPAYRYVMVDYKLRILAAMKAFWKERLVTVFPRQG